MIRTNNNPQDVVLSFVREMNDWEHKMYLLSRIESGDVINHEADKALLPQIPYTEFLQKYDEVFNRHCTQRQRKFGGQPNSWARHGSYKDITVESVESVDEVKPGRVEVIVRGGLFPDNRFLFVVFKKGDEWRIDSAKWGKTGHWETYHL